MPKHLRAIFPGEVENVREKLSGMKSFRMHTTRAGLYTLDTEHEDLHITNIETKFPKHSPKFQFLRAHMTENDVELYRCPYSFLRVTHVIIFSHGSILFIETTLHPQRQYKIEISDSMKKMIFDALPKLETSPYKLIPQKFSAIRQNGNIVGLTKYLKLLLNHHHIVINGNELKLEKNSGRGKYIFIQNLPYNEKITGCELRSNIPQNNIYPQKISLTMENGIVIFTRIK